MRTIKFRGKDFAKEWVYGDLIHKRHDPNTPMIQDENGLGSDVSPDTVGQFTGLLDKNGKEIYEGDIVLIPETENNAEITGDVQFDRGSYLVRSFLSGACHSLAWAVRERMVGEKRGEVIGNIHDNPELCNK